jgi:NADPH2:quinone reductase
MLAIRVHQQGGPEVLQIEELPEPQPGPGQARVNVAAIGVNFLDIYQRGGVYSMQLPFTLGAEAAGVVDAVGPDVTAIQPGDRVVAANILGAYAEQVIVPVERLAPVPEGLDLTDAAAVFLQGLTAHYLTHSTFPLQPGHTCLAHAVAGGTGQLLVQMAKLREARVIGTVSREHKAVVAFECGCDELIVSSEKDFEAETRRLTGGHGVDVVYDSVGVDTFEKSLNCLRPRGTMVLFGQSSGRVPPIDPLTLNAKGSLYLTRPTLGAYIATREEFLGRAADIFAWMAEGRLRVRVDRTFPLREAAEAHRYLASRQALGKVLLLP